MPFPTPWQGSADFSYTSKPFFSDEPKTLMERGDVPRNVEIMIGSNKDDGMLQSTTLYHNEEKFENFKYVKKLIISSYGKVEIKNLYFHLLSKQ
jgi:hypothetical protein